MSGVNPSQPGRRLAELELTARKGLGQHFLTDKGVLNKIICAADLSQEDTVIEVGPGLGILTEELVKKACKVVAVELDKGLATALQQQFQSSPNFLIVNEDILKITPCDLLVRAGALGNYKVVANLPYYITSAVMRHFLEPAERPGLMVVMVQREVAKSITAAPGGLSLLGISVQLFGEPCVISRVPAGAFYPAPKVESAIVRVETYPVPLVPQDEIPGFFLMARAAFSAARKQVQNSLAHSLEMTRQEVVSRLSAAGINPSRRAETLSIAEWVRLWQEFKTVLCRR